MDQILVNVLVVVRLAWWPFGKFFSAVRLVLSPVLHTILLLLTPVAVVGRFVLLPFIHLIRALFFAITLPLQVQWLERIEVYSCIIIIVLGQNGRVETARHSTSFSALLVS